MSSFEGKVIAITGGASGIGLALAKILHSRGAKLSIADWSQTGLDEATECIGSTDVLAYQCDVRDLAQVREWLKTTVERFGKLDGAANMAGVIPKKDGGSGLVEDQDEDDWERVIGVNLTGTMHCMKEEVKLMQPGSSIVNAGSIAGIRGLHKSAAYCASKHAIVGLTRACSKDYGPKGIRINAIAPGYTATPMFDAAAQGKEDLVAAHAGTMPIGRVGEAEEVARVICFLLSSESSFVTGSVSSVDGGWQA